MKLLKRLVPYVLALVVIGAGAGYALRNAPAFESLEISSWGLIPWLVATSIIIVILNGLVFRLLVEEFGVGLSFPEALGLSFLTAIGAYVVPGVGGLGLRGAYLKKKHGFQVSKFVSTIGVSFVLTLALNAVVGLCVFFGLYLSGRVESLVIPAIFAVVAAGGVIVLFVPSGRWPARLPLFKKADSTLAGWRSLLRNRKLMTRLVVLLLTISLAAVVNLYLALSVFDSGVTFLDAFVISSMDILTLVVNITPDRIGISEGAVLATSDVFGYAPAAVLAGTVIRRLVSILVAVLGGGVSALLLARSVSAANPKS